MLLLSLLLAAAPETKIITAKGAFCPTLYSHAKANKAPLRVHPTTQEPPAKRLLAVADLDTGGCLKPRVVSEQVGPPAR